jgi:glycosyltransferase involved in cell wall biosynthesis
MENKRRPTLAVLITYFNERELLTECLESLLPQREAPEEVWVYDDSSDFSAAAYVPAGARVQIVRGSGDVGPSPGRNTLLKRSHSDYVHFHDADDLFLPHWAERVREAIAGSGADVILTEATASRNGQVLHERFVELERDKDKDFTSLVFSSGIMPCVSTIRRESVLAIGGYRPHLKGSEDFDFHVRLAVSGASLVRILEPQVIFRIRDDAFTHRERKDHLGWVQRLDVVRTLSKELPARYHSHLGYEAMLNGSRLFRLGAHREARQAFRLARELGCTAFDSGPRWYQGLARAIGPWSAEWVLDIRHRLAQGLKQLGLLSSARDESRGRSNVV